MWTLVFFVFLLKFVLFHSLEYDQRIFDVTNLPTLSFMRMAGENVSLTCPGVTEDSIVSSLEWYSVTLHGKVVQYMSNTFTVWNDQHRIVLLPDNYALNFDPVTATDSGDYICLANDRARPEAVVRLMVKDVAEPLERPLIKGFTSRYANLSWAPPQDTHYSEVTHYIIETRQGEKGSWDTIKAIVTKDNSTDYRVTGLHPFSVYSFRVASVNAVGISPPSIASYYIITLREAPVGKPIITTAYNISSSAIHLSWRPPHLSTLNGEFLGYRITYRPRNKGIESAKEIYIRNHKVESHVIQNLEAYTQYLVSLQVFNPEGLGPNTTVRVMTDEGVPSKPIGLIALEVSPYEILLNWQKPDKENGVILGYRVYYMYGNITEVSEDPIKVTSPSITCNLTGLKPLTVYKIWAKAYTKEAEGDSSDPIVNATDISPPSAPLWLNLTCQKEETMFIHWARPEHYYKAIDFYYVYISYGDYFVWKNLSIEAETKALDVSISLENITMNTVYKVEVQASTRSNRTKRFIYGPKSAALNVYMQNDCDKIQEQQHRNEFQYSAGFIVGIIVFLCTLILFFSGYVAWRYNRMRRCLRPSYYYLDVPHSSKPMDILEWNAPPNTVEENTEYKGAISVQHYAQHVSELHADGDIGFSKEYDAIQGNVLNPTEYTSEHSTQAENRGKNRYLNIIAYDHSRVQLLPLPGQKKGLDYINANYIDGFEFSKVYIGTQGPLPTSFDSFWRMVWEQRVNIIIMITNLVERGRRKCDMYWPKEGTEIYGVIEVTLVKEEVMATYTVRTLQMKHLKVKTRKPSKSEKLVYQYHYTNWPDHGTPDHPLPVLHFVKKSAAANPIKSGPIVVHCSAGVGRTGTYIVLDAMLKQIRKTGEVNVFGFLRHIRYQRNFLVQTEEQYIFIHDALVEAIESGETNIAREQFPRYVQQLQENNDEEKRDIWKRLDVQFNLVSSFQCKEFHLVSASKMMNQTKNRSKTILPVESSRVHLTPRAGEDGSDYINASWIQGFHSLREFIITQHPLKSTFTNFWQMVWDHSSQLIVMLSIIDNQNYEIFWPMEQDTIEAELFKVRLIRETVKTNYVLREFIMEAVQDDYEIPVKMIQCTNWPHHCGSITEIYELPNVLLDMGHHNGPVIVVDRYGGSEAASFCSLVSLKKHLMYDNHVDVYMYAKLYHNKRPGIWGSIGDYLRLHLAVQTLCAPPESTPDLYAMTNGGTSVICMQPNNHTQPNNHQQRVPPEEFPLVPMDLKYNHADIV